MSVRKVKVGKRGVSIVGDNSGKLSTGDTHIYDQRDQRTMVQVAAPSGASIAELRRAYLDWLHRRANERRCLSRTAASRCSSRRSIRRC